AIVSLPWRERKVIGLYYYAEVTMKQIGAEIGVNESRVSQLHARAIRQLRDALGDLGTLPVAEIRRALVAFASRRPKMIKVQLPGAAAANKSVAAPGIVLPYKPSNKRRTPTRPPVKTVRPHRVLAAAR